MNEMRNAIPIPPTENSLPIAAAVDNNSEMKALIRDLKDENEFMKDREMNFVETVRLLKKQIEKERAESRQFKTDANAFRNKKSEMEDVFLQCVE